MEKENPTGKALERMRNLADAYQRTARSAKTHELELHFLQARDTVLACIEIVRQESEVTP